MHAQNLVINESSDWKHVEAGDELLPKTESVPVFTLFIKTINLGDILTLVIASQQEN